MNTAQRSAVDAFVAHVRSCNQCFTANSGDLRCQTGQDLWSAGDRAFAAAKGVSLDKIVNVEHVPAQRSKIHYPGHREGMIANDMITFASLLRCNALRGTIGLCCNDGTII